MSVSFKLLNENAGGRLGQIITTHGVIDTPAFMPVGTAATVKSLLIDQVKSTGAQIILGNTYHLMLRPGIERIKRVGGLHQFMNCNLPILTDSGGFQVMSLSKISKITDDGVYFNSHIDGKKIFLSPEISIQIQKDLNSDIVMIFDECPEYTKDKNRVLKAVNLSIDWAKKSKIEFGNNPNKLLFGIVQGGIFNDLRKQSLDQLIEINFDGYALGGLAVGESQQEMFDVLDYISPFLPREKAHYLMGVGTPSDLLGAVKRGMDMFDCVLPTRSGRTGLAYTWTGKKNLKNAKYALDDTPLDPIVNCHASNSYSKSYLNHLVNSNEILASILLSWHNVAFYQDLMQKIRDAIKNNNFENFYKENFELLNS